MIVLKRIVTQPSAAPSACYEIAGTLSGTQNESNQVFYTEYDYEPDTVSVLYNGQALHSPNDFLETGPNEITFIYMKPRLETVLRANYQYRDCSSVPPQSQRGRQIIPNGVDSQLITFSAAFSDVNYIVTTSLTNTIDGAAACVFPYIIGSKTVNGFTVYFQGDIDSSNYVLEWIAMSL